MSRPTDDLIRTLLKKIPTNWCDPLLTGPNAVIGKPPFGCPDVENLLHAIRARLTDAYEALAVPPAPPTGRDPHTTEWYERAAAAEDGHDVTAGSESAFSVPPQHVWRPIETAPRHGYFFAVWDNGAQSAVRWSYAWENWPSIEKYVALPNRVQGWWIPTSALPPAPLAANQVEK